MRSILSRAGKLFSAGIIFGLGLLAAIGTVGYASTLSLRTGPLPASDLPSIINQLVNDINTCCAAGGSGTIPQALSVIGGQNGAIQVTGSGAWVANGSVATSLTSVGPTGARTTVQRWLRVRDNNGLVVYIPAF